MWRSIRRFWILRYRLYAVLALLLCIPVLYASNTNLPPNVTANGYIVLNSNIFAQRIERNKGNQNIAKAEEKLETTKTPTKETKNTANYDYTSEDITAKIKEIGINLGTINAQNLRDLKLPIPVNERIAELPIEEVNELNLKNGKSLESLYPKPENPQRTSYIRIPEYKINSPIVYAKFEDMYNKNPDGTINFSSPRDPIDIESKGPLQLLLRDGIVCLPIAPFTGDIGNSYCIGHSSNNAGIKSDYNEVLRPIMQKGNPGEEFFFYDAYGRELKFRIFESLAIEEANGNEAYRPFPGRRVLTLQTSIVSFRSQKGLYPYQRWLVRAELICADNNPCKE